MWRKRRAELRWFGAGAVWGGRWLCHELKANTVLRGRKGPVARSPKAKKESKPATSRKAQGKAQGKVQGKPQAKPQGSKLTRAQIDEMFARFQDRDPDPKTELDYHDPYTLLVAVVLSAQATDASSIVPPPLFFRLPTRRQK